MSSLKNLNKVVSYLGFAQKSNNCIVGQTALKKNYKQLHLVIVCTSASDNLKDLAINLANKHQCKYLILANLSDLLNLKDIKIVGLTDFNLSNAIIQFYENE